MFKVVNPKRFQFLKVNQDDIHNYVGYPWDMQNLGTETALKQAKMMAKESFP